MIPKSVRDFKFDVWHECSANSLRSVKNLKSSQISNLQVWQTDLGRASSINLQRTDPPGPRSPSKIEGPWTLDLRNYVYTQLAVPLRCWGWGRLVTRPRTHSSNLRPCGKLRRTQCLVKWSGFLDALLFPPQSNVSIYMGHVARTHRSQKSRDVHNSRNRNTSHSYDNQLPKAHLNRVRADTVCDFEGKMRTLGNSST